MTPDNFSQLLNREEISFFLSKKHLDTSWSTLLSPASTLATNSAFIEMLQKIIDTYAKNLGHIIRKKINGRIISVGQPEIGDFFITQTEAFKLNFDSSESAIACILPTQSVHFMTMAALGNIQTSSSSTELGQRIVHHCLKPLSQSIRNAFSGLTNISAETLPIINKEQLPKAFVSAAFMLDIGSTEIKLILTFPHEIRKFFARSDKSLIAVQNKPQPDSMLSKITADRVDVTAVTPTTEYNLQEICKWKPGSFIPLSMHPDDDIFLSAENIPLLTGTIGRKGRCIAIKTKKKVTKNDKL